MNNIDKGNHPAEALPTSRNAHRQERGVLAVLRSLMPARPLEDLAEAMVVAELQANRFLALADLEQPPVPAELITELPRIRVHRDVDLPASGSAVLTSGRWTLTINGSEPYTRQRFSLAHEFKHVLDHPIIDRYSAAGIDGEIVADCFAACLLMPKREVKRLWGQGVQRLSDLSGAFEVSPPAMARRLQHLGLRSVLPRHATNQYRDDPRGRRTYYRPLSLLGDTA